VQILSRHSIRISSISIEKKKLLLSFERLESDDA